MAFAAPAPSFFKDSKPGPLWSDGPAPGCLHEFPSKVIADQGHQHTTQPMSTGASVLGVRFNGGVMIAADTLGSYGSLARFRSISRLISLTKDCVMGCSGDIADMQELKSMMESWIILDQSMQYPYKQSARGLFSTLTRVMYQRRCEMNPFWNHLVIAGVDQGDFLLGVVDKLGVAYQAPVVGTGYGAHLALPLMRAELEKTPGGLSQEQAKNLLIRSMRLLFYRDCRASIKYEIDTVTDEGHEIEGPLRLDTDWSISRMVQSDAGNQDALGTKGGGEPPREPVGDAEFNRNRSLFELANIYELGYFVKKRLDIEQRKTLFKECVRANRDNVHNFSEIVFNYIQDHGKGNREFSNIAGLLFYYISKTDKTAGNLYDLIVKVNAGCARDLVAFLKDQNNWD